MKRKSIDAHVQQNAQACRPNNVANSANSFANYSLADNQFKIWKYLSSLPANILQQRRQSTLSQEIETFLSNQARNQQEPSIDQSNVECAKLKTYATTSCVIQTALPLGNTGKASSLASASNQNVNCNATTNRLKYQANTNRQRKHEQISPATTHSSLTTNCSISEDEESSLYSSGYNRRASKRTNNKHRNNKIDTANNKAVNNNSANSLSLTLENTKHAELVKVTDKSIDSDGSVDEGEKRVLWNTKMDFLLSIIGFAVDLANIWRFPYLCYRNGGGVFLIPYCAMLIFGGIPLFFLELLLGQYVKKGPLTVWNNICPAMKGVGYCSILIAWYVSFYYNVLIAWAVYFIYRSISSFNGKMPWEDCDNPWNTAACVSLTNIRENCASNGTDLTLEQCRKQLYSNVVVTSPAQEFFVKELSQLDQSRGFDDLGVLRPELVVCLLIVYLLHYFSLFRGLETSGKVVWVTATAPYMILSILLIRGLFLPGAAMGIEYYLSPKLEKLAEPQVWIDAANQVFYSIGVGFGVHLTYASFNPHNNNCHRDCLVTSAVNAVTSWYSGLVVFVYLGYMSQNLGIEIDKVASEGYSLVFEVYPEALTTLPGKRFWSILFFIMLLTLGIDSAMGGLEAVITGLEDEFKIIRKLKRWQLTALVVASSFLPALVSCTQGGAYTLFWFDIYSAGTSLLFAALFETIGVVYCYGLDKFIANIESMLNKKPPMFYIICWKFISPAFLAGVIVMSLTTVLDVPTYRNYIFPGWSIALGWMFAFSSVCAIPVYALFYWFKQLKAQRNMQLEISNNKHRTQNSNNNNNYIETNHDACDADINNEKNYSNNDNIDDDKCTNNRTQSTKLKVNDINKSKLSNELKDANSKLHSIVNKSHTSVTCAANHQLATSQTKTKTISSTKNLSKQVNKKGSSTNEKNSFNSKSGKQYCEQVV